MLAQDLDRISREPWHYESLHSLFEDRGAALGSLDDAGNDSPMGEFMRYIRRGVAKLEKADIAKRTRRGKIQKAQEGKVVATMKAPYGFSYTASRDALVIDDGEMAVVERIFRMAADGLGTKAIQGRLRELGVPAPRGGEVWKRDVLKGLVASDAYLPRSHEEVSDLVSPKVAAGLDPGKEYAISWWNRNERKTTYVPRSEAGRPRKRTKYLPRDESEWIAVPIPASGRLPRALVERAREMMASHTRPQRKHLARPWELRGAMRCPCGVLMGTHTVWVKKYKKPYHYYACKVRHDYKRGLCDQKMIRAERAEGPVWSFVSGLLKDPERLRAGMDALIEAELAGGADPGTEARILHEKIDECARSRAAYQDQQAAGLMTLDELAARLEDLDRSRSLAEAELANLSERQKRAEDLSRGKETLLVSYSEAVPRELDGLLPEDKNHVYRLLRLEVAPAGEGFRVSGAFCSSELSCWRTGRRAP